MANKSFRKAKKFFNKGNSFVRKGLNNLLLLSTHIDWINIRYYCDSNVVRIYPNNFFHNEIENKPKPFKKHYYTKTVKEFCKEINKGDAHYNISHPNYLEIIKLRIKLFFLWNRITNYKIKILENCTGINLNEYKKYKIW